jgi:hypothetical protein
MSHLEATRSKLTDIAIPVLPSLDFDRTEPFYNNLGFATFYRVDDFLGVRRGRMEIHFWPCADPELPNASGCYLRVTDVDALHREMSPAVEPPARIVAPEDRPWGMREFYIWDPDGNLLKIGAESSV